MANPEPNYVKEVLTSQWNLAFIGVMFLLMVIVNFIGFGALLIGGEILALLIAQVPAVQHYIRLKAQIDDKENSKLKEQEMVLNLPPNYQNDFQSIKQICDEIEDRWRTQGNQGNYLLSDLINKLGSFRFEYARMLNAHFLTANRDVNRLSTRLQAELQNNVNLFQAEKSAKVKEVLQQNIRILKQRLQKALQMSDLQRLLEARLAVVKNSLSLLQDEVYTVSDPSNMSDAVNNLLLTLDIDEELKSTYEDVLSRSDEKVPPPNADQQQNLNAQRQSNLRRIK